MAGRPRKPGSDLDRDRGGKPQPGAPFRPSRVPPPPERYGGREFTQDEKDCWVELAAQVEARGTYAPEFHEAFVLLVTRTARLRRLEGVNNLTLGLLREVTKLLGRFGLTPRDSAYVPPAAAGDDDDPYAEFRVDAGGGGRGPRRGGNLRVVQVATNGAGPARPGTPGAPGGTGSPTSTPPKRKPWEAA